METNSNNKIKEFKTTDFLATIKQMKTILVTTIICAFTACSIFGILFIKTAKNNEKEIYVVSDAGTFMAKRNDYGVRYEFEIKNHIRTFLQLFYENDQHSFNKNVDAALNLIDKEDGRKIYKGFNEKAYDFYVQNNAYSKVIIDSMRISMAVRPYVAKVYFKIVLYYAGNSKPMYDAAVMSISENVRSEKNPFGLMIQNFRFIKYEIDADRSSTIQDSLSKEKLKEELKRNYDGNK
jgi:hypothetical protein